MSKSTQTLSRTVRTAWLACIVVLSASTVRAAPLHDLQRPFYVIAHMANSVKTMDAFLAEGANAVELDVTFEPNGAAWWVFHGYPCDYFRVCHESTQLVDYLRAASSRNMSLMVLDLKTSKLGPEAKTFAGVDVARKLTQHFWGKGAQDVSVVLSVPHVTDKGFIKSFIHELKEIDPEQMKRVSFDVSENPEMYQVENMYRELNVTSAWQGDGVTNWLEPFRGFSRIRSVVEMRDTATSPIKKIYRWTVDYKKHIRELIHMGVDAVMTNHPSRARQVVNELREARLATARDDINEAVIV